MSYCKHANKDISAEKMRGVPDVDWKCVFAYIYNNSITWMNSS